MGHNLPDDIVPAMVRDMLAHLIQKALSRKLVIRTTHTSSLGLLCFCPAKSRVVIEAVQVLD